MRRGTVRRILNKIDELSQVRYPDDCRRIMRIIAERTGVHLTPLEAEAVWEEVSGDYCAGWLILGDNDDAVFTQISRLLE